MTYRFSDGTIYETTFNVLGTVASTGVTQYFPQEKTIDKVSIEFENRPAAGGTFTDSDSKKKSIYTVTDYNYTLDSGEETKFKSLNNDIANFVKSFGEYSEYWGDGYIYIYQFGEGADLERRMALDYFGVEIL